MDSSLEQVLGDDEINNLIITVLSDMNAMIIFNQISNSSINSEKVYFYISDAVTKKDYEPGLNKLVKLGMIRLEQDEISLTYKAIQVGNYIRNNL